MAHEILKLVEHTEMRALSLKILTFSCFFYSFDLRSLLFVIFRLTQLIHKGKNPNIETLL